MCIAINIEITDRKLWNFYLSSLPLVLHPVSLLVSALYAVQGVYRHPFMQYLQPGWDPGPMRRKCANYHLQWKNKSCKRLCGFCCMKGWCPAAPSLSDRCFLSLLGKHLVHIRLCPPVPLNNLNPDIPSLISRVKKTFEYSCLYTQLKVLLHQ